MRWKGNDKRGEKFVAFDVEIVEEYHSGPQHNIQRPAQGNTIVVNLLSFFSTNMSSSKTNYKALSEILMANLTVDGLKKTIKSRHPSMSVQGNKEDLQKRLADAEGLTLPSGTSSISTTPTSTEAKTKNLYTAQFASLKIGDIPGIDPEIKKRFDNYEASA